MEYDVHAKSSYLSRGNSEPQKREQSVSKKSRLSLAGFPLPERGRKWASTIRIEVELKATGFRS